LIEAWNNMLETLSNIATPGMGGSGGGNNPYSKQASEMSNKLLSIKVKGEHKIPLLCC